MDWSRVVRTVVPGARPEIVAMIANHAGEILPRFGIKTLRRQASLLAHMAHETAGFTRLEENLNYRAARLAQVWPKRFPTVAEAAPYANNPVKLAIKVYGGRMGNLPGTMDGWTFRGMGGIQTTGRDNVTRLGARLGVSAETAAKWLIDPEHMLECAAATYEMLGVGPFADKDDVAGETRRINGGSNGLAERREYRKRFMRALAAQAAPTPTGVVSAEAAPDDDMEKVTVADLRAEGSRTIAGADQVKTGLQGALVSAGSAAAVVSQVGDVATQAQTAATSIAAVRSPPGALEWAQANWHVLAIVALSTALAYCLWRIYAGAQHVEAARLDDARTGVNLGR